MREAAPTNATTTTFIEIVPDPELVRQRLGQCVREAQILRRQLRASERAAKEREQQQREVRRAG